LLSQERATSPFPTQEMAYADFNLWSMQRKDEL
jgi:hypothetical protein